MDNSIFRNSKAALIFAGAVVVSAVVLIGSPEEKGVVNKAVDLVGQPRETVAAEPNAAAMTPTVVETQSKSKSRWVKPNWDNNPPSPFGENSLEDPPVPGQVAPTASASNTPKISRKANTPGPPLVVADNKGTPIPGNDGD